MLVLPRQTHPPRRDWLDGPTHTLATQQRRSRKGIRQAEVRSAPPGGASRELGTVLTPTGVVLTVAVVGTARGGRDVIHPVFQVHYIRPLSLRLLINELWLIDML